MLTRPSYLLRLEETALLVGAVALYWQMHFSWVLFAVRVFGARFVYGGVPGGAEGGGCDL